MDNRERIRRVYEVWDSPEGLAGSLAMFDSDFKYVNPEGAIEPGTRHGHDGMLEVVRSLRAAFSEYSHDVHELIETGDKVVALTTFRARGRDSGATVEVPEQHIWTLRDGAVVSFEWFHDERKARKVAGL
jgi:ketosteroid isomerase-like protein